MSSKSFAFTAPGNSRAWDEYDSCSTDYDPYWNRQRSGEDRSTHAPWRLFEERVRTGPYGLTRFPSQPYSPIRVLGGDVEDRVNPRLRQFVRDAPPQVRRRWHLVPEDPGLRNEEERKKATKKLGKRVYNPSRRAWKGNGKDEGERCTICLDAFLPNEEVVMTPCNHIFHGDCLAPWLKEHAKCPVCRHAFFSERKQETGSSSRSSSSNNNNHHGRNLAGDLSLLIRAMEEAFNWVSYSQADSCH